MKKLAVFIAAGIICSCNNAETKNATKDSTAASATTTATATVNYPYTIKNPDNWEIGSTANTLVALSSLKAWEEGKLDESLKYFADSIHVKFDGIDKKMSNDSLKAFFTGGRNSYKTVTERMSDWESVISKDKTQEWVTIWYTQIWETKQGVKDSSEVINDIQLKSGKIIRIDEYNRKFH